MVKSGSGKSTACAKGRASDAIGAWTFSAGDISLALVKDHGGREVIVIGEPVGDRVRIWAEGCGRLEGSLLFEVWLDQPKARHLKVPSRFGHLAQLLHARTLRQIILKAISKRIGQEEPMYARIMRARLCNPKKQFYEGNLGTVLICPECSRALEGVQAPQGAGLLNLPLHFRPLREDIAMAIESTGLLPLRS
jgi:hypothetical protein